MKLSLLLLLSIFNFLSAFAGRISGLVTNQDGQPLPFASLTVKGTSIGTTANSTGEFFLSVSPGTYTIICQHVGYERQEKKITIIKDDLQLDFRLEKQELTLGEVIVTQGEDPAYEIIRQAIRKRVFYRDQLSAFQCQVYTKGQLQLRDYPKKFMGQIVDFEDGDTSKNKMLYLSETIARYSYRRPDDVKIEVISTKVSGQTGGFGLSAPHIFSFYDNNINIGSGLNPRGFISPISENALNYYRYKYEGFFMEEGKQVFRIRIIPRRPYEPLFSGIMYIMDEDYRVHSVQLELTKTSQMQILDTLRIEQLYVPVSSEVWMVKSQVMYPSVKMLGFDGFGSFVNMYSDFDIDPDFGKKFFDNTILKYTDSSNKQTLSYWENARPLPLQEEEIIDYRKKDSLEQVRADPRYLDSISRRRNKLNPIAMLINGQSFTRESKKRIITIPNLLELIKYNTVEGFVLNPQLTYYKSLDTGIGRKAIAISPQIRYGFSNEHFNASTKITYTYGKKYANNFSLSGGKDIYQFNNYSNQGERGATLSALLFKHNRRKIYEAWYLRTDMLKVFGEGFSTGLSFQYQDRMPLENTAFYSLSKSKDTTFTPNYPENFDGPGFLAHQASSVSFTVRWQPGNRYIEFPGRKISIGSRYPAFMLTYTKGIKNFLGSDVDYDKWRLQISDQVNLKLAGSLNYRFSTGGFLNARNVQIPDYTHFIGNLSLLATDYMTGFQLLPHYQKSNTDKLVSTLFAEYHLNGFLTNKIPVFRKLNWHFVTGVNAMYGSEKFRYTEVFVGIENILKIIRIDYVQGFDKGRTIHGEVRIGILGITTN
ncbi:MAG: carboxypeptidase-like regulatory domain-containing protein [Chitinophagaceae bacterium]|nr:carboxypeptidase-like regulatory domain-containing protein [Chitinophagaceae bacterium]